MNPRRSLQLISKTSGKAEPGRALPLCAAAKPQAYSDRIKVHDVSPSSLFVIQHTAVVLK
jgi:hypothetical protein